MSKSPALSANSSGEKVPYFFASPQGEGIRHPNLKPQSRQTQRQGHVLTGLQARKPGTAQFTDPSLAGECFQREHRPLTRVENPNRAIAFGESLFSSSREPRRPMTRSRYSLPATRSLLPKESIRAGCWGWSAPPSRTHLRGDSFLKTSSRRAESRRTGASNSRLGSGAKEDGVPDIWAPACPAEVMARIFHPGTKRRGYSTCGKDPPSAGSAPGPVTTS